MAPIDMLLISVGPTDHVNKLWIHSPAYHQPIINTPILSTPHRIISCLTYIAVNNYCLIAISVARIQNIAYKPYIFC